MDEVVIPVAFYPEQTNLLSLVELRTANGSTQLQYLILIAGDGIR